MALDTLGNKYCIHSLRQDLTDLQETVTDVFSRIGPVRCHSWKYPDKMSCDIDMTEILDVYDYSEDTEDRQIAHIVLLEMVIDRLLLLIQAMTKFQETTLSSTTNLGDTSAQSSKLSASVGLEVKRFWNKLVHVNTLFKNLSSEHKSCKRKLSDFSNNLSKVADEKEELSRQVGLLTDSLRATNSPYPLNDEDVLKLMMKHSPERPISECENHKSSQTIETAFVPCESCGEVQKHYQHLGDVFINACKAQKLPSALFKFKPKIEEVSWLTGSDIISWSRELEKDVKVIEEHLEAFDEVRAKLGDEKKRCKELKGKVTDLEKEIRKEKDTQGLQQKHYEEKIKNIEAKNAETVKMIEKQKEGVIMKRNQLEEQLGKFREQLKQQEVLMNQIEQANQKLQTDLSEASATAERVGELEQEVAELQHTVEAVDGQMVQAQEEYEKEKALKESVQKHTQSIQNKQQSVLQRLNNLDQENEKYRIEISELEEAKEELEKCVQTAREEKEEVEKKVKQKEELITELKSEKEKLQDSMTTLKDEISMLETQVAEAKERERLLIENPDQSPQTVQTPTSSNDIVTDMEQQISANSLRICALEEQNAKLRRCVDKILETRGAGDQPRSAENQPRSGQAKDPVRLWNTSAADQNFYQHQSYVPDYGTSKPAPGSGYVPSKPPPSSGHYLSKLPPSTGKSYKQQMNDLYAVSEQTKVRQSVLVGRGWTPTRETPVPDKTQSKNRPKSGKQARDNTASLKAYKQIQKNGSAFEVKPGSGFRSTPVTRDVFVCPRCEKSYDKQKDLSVHMSYCRR